MILDGKVALVTGGARGIGRAISTEYARVGATVVVADLGVDIEGLGGSDEPAADAAAEIIASGGSAYGQAVDVTNRDDVDNLVYEVVSRYGGVDVVVNAAGNMVFAPLVDLTPEDWRRTIDIHLTGAFNVCQAVAAHWSTSSLAGALINIGSDAGFTGVETAAAYSAAKAGIVGLTLSLAQALVEQGGSANVLIPQASTRITEQIPIEDRPDSERWATGEFAPENVTPIAIYLASDDGRWLTGQIIGGFGYEVHQYSMPQRIRSIYSDGPWSLDLLGPKVVQVFQS